MAAKAGWGGSVVFAGLTVGIKTWILNMVNEPLETTALADNQNRTFIAGLNSFSGSFEGNWDSANTLMPGESGAATFNIGSGTADQLTASILITGYDIEDAFDGVVAGPITFQGTGAQPA